MDQSGVMNTHHNQDDNITHNMDANIASRVAKAYQELVDAQKRLSNLDEPHHSTVSGVQDKVHECEQTLKDTINELEAIQEASNNSFRALREDNIASWAAINELRAEIVALKANSAVTPQHMQ